MIDPDPGTAEGTAAGPSWARLSALVTAGANCVACGADEDLVAHHRIPRRFGGADSLENLEPVCRSCHPRVEREAVERARLEWVSPALDRIADPPRRRLRRPY